MVPQKSSVAVRSILVHRGAKIARRHVGGQQHLGDRPQGRPPMCSQRLIRRLKTRRNAERRRFPGPTCPTRRISGLQNINRLPGQCPTACRAVPELMQLIFYRNRHLWIVGFSGLTQHRRTENRPRRARVRRRPWWQPCLVPGHTIGPWDGEARQGTACSGSTLRGHGR